MDVKIDKEKIIALQSELEKGSIEKVVVGAVIISDNKVLLLRRKAGEFMEGLVELPSGGVDEGEGILEALEREVVEETGLTVISVDAYIGHFDYRSGSGKKTRQLNFSITTKGEVQVNPEEHDQFIWISPTNEEFETLNISEKTKGIIKKAV